MDYIFWTGILGSLVLLSGAAWPEAKSSKAILSTKNWLFATGGLIMLLYSFFGYQADGPFFFVVLETLVVLASILMMLDTPDKIDIPIIGTCSSFLIIWSIYLFEDYRTIIFILGLCGIGLGYTLEMRSLNRNLALTIGSLLIAIFSYTESSWIFFWLNSFFCIFSGYYALQSWQHKTK